MPGGKISFMAFMMYAIVITLRQPILSGCASIILSNVVRQSQLFGRHDSALVALTAKPRALPTSPPCCLGEPIHRLAAVFQLSHQTEDHISLGQALAERFLEWSCLGHARRRPVQRSCAVSIARLLIVTLTFGTCLAWPDSTKRLKVSPA